MSLSPRSMLEAVRAEASRKYPDSDKAMTVDEVLSVFDKNEAAGEDRFLGTKVRVSGKVKKVERVSWSDMAPPPFTESDENYYLLTLSR